MKPSEARRLDRLAQELVTPERFDHEYTRSVIIPIDHLRRMNSVPGCAFLPEVTKVYDGEEDGPTAA